MSEPGDVRWVKQYGSVMRDGVDHIEEKLVLQQLVRLWSATPRLEWKDVAIEPDLPWRA